MSCLLQKDNKSGKNCTRGNSRGSSDASGRSGRNEKVDRLTTCSPRYEQVASTDAADNVNGNGNNAAVEVILPDPVKSE